MANENGEKKVLGGIFKRKSSGKPAKAKSGKKRFDIARWLREMISELKKVTWPTKQDLINYTTVVVVFIVIMAAVVGVLDFGAGSLFQFFTGLGS